MPIGVYKRPPVEERFWTNVKKERAKGCWNWIASKNHNGYGQFQVLDESLAHRVSWVIHFGVIPNRLHVLHKCDNPACIRPDHLFLGTQLDNMRDMHSKSRQNPPHGNEHWSQIKPENVLHGENAGNVKLTEKDVFEIRSLYSTGLFMITQLAKMFNISHTQIWKIVHRTAWKHI